MIFDLFRKHGAESRPLTSQELERILRAGAASSSTGISVTPESAIRYGTVFACVRVRAESVGQLPLHFYERRGRQKLKAEDHPLYSLLHDAPNEMTTSQEFWEWVSACLDLHGNAFALINRLPTGAIFELLPLQPNWVTVKLDQKRDLLYTVRIPLGSGGYDQRDYTARQVLHFRGMSLNGLTGASIIEHARETIAMGMALEKHGGKFFQNGGAPGGLLKTDQELSEANFKRLKSSWEDAHAGIDNAHRVAILEKGISWQSVGITMKDAQFLEGRQFSRSDIAGLFRVPPHLIGDLSRATFSNIEHQGLDFVRHALVPTLTRIEQRIRLQLVPKEERPRYFAKFNVNGLVRGDMTARSAFYTAQLQNGALSPNEIRELEDMNPRDGGDIYLTPMNMLIDGQPAADEEPAASAEGAGDE